MAILIVSESNLIHGEEGLLGPAECTWELTLQRWEVRWLYAALLDLLGHRLWQPLG